MPPKTALPRIEIPPPPAREYATEFTSTRIPGSLKLELVTLARARGETVTEFIIQAIRDRIACLTQTGKVAK